MSQGCKLIVEKVDKLMHKGNKNAAVEKKDQNTLLHFYA